MKTFTFITITLFSGAIAGAILGLINQGMVEPFIDKAIGIETQRQVNAGKIIDFAQQSQYRTWQKEGEIVAAIIMGVSLASLFGVVFAYTQSSLPGSDNEKKAVILAGLMFVVLFLVPAINYPANPPAVGNPATIYYRESLFIGFIAVSGFSTLGLALLYRKLGKNQSKRKIGIPLIIYSAIMISAYLVLTPTLAALGWVISDSAAFGNSLLIRKFSFLPFRNIWEVRQITRQNINSDHAKI